VCRGVLLTFDTSPDRVVLKMCVNVANDVLCCRVFRVKECSECVKGKCNTVVEWRASEVVCVACGCGCGEVYVESE
jgi:hypothetical protein